MKKALVALVPLMFAFACSDSTDSPGTSPDAGANNETGTAADTGAGSGCSFGEPNDTRETSTAIALGTTYPGICVSGVGGAVADAVDFYELTAPADAAGGIVEVQITNVSAIGLVDLGVFASSDNGSISAGYETTEGASHYAWFTVSPGAKYRLVIQRFAGDQPQYTYDLTTKYTAIADAFEPNQTKETAKALTLNTPIQASAAVHSAEAEIVATDDADYYKFTITGTTATVTLSNAPADYLCDLEMYDSAGADKGSNYSTTEGGNCEIAATELTPGTFYVNVHKFSGTPIRGGQDKDVPPTTKNQYTLVVK